MTERETTDVDLDLSELTALVGEPVVGVFLREDGRWIAAAPSGDQWVLGEPAAVEITTFNDKRGRVLITAKTAACADGDRTRCRSDPNAGDQAGTNRRSQDGD